MTESATETAIETAAETAIETAAARSPSRHTGPGCGGSRTPGCSPASARLLLAARKVPAALKWIEDRRENLMAAGQARHEHGEARIAFAADGTITAVSIDHVSRRSE